MVIQHTVKLTDGRTVKAYYLDEEDKRFLYSLQTHIAQSSYSFTRMLDKLTILREILYDDLVAHHKAKLLDIISRCYKDKSFHASDLWFTNGFHKERLDAFQKLVEEGVVVERGSGWYRLK